MKMKQSRVSEEQKLMSHCAGESADRLSSCSEGAELNIPDTEFDNSTLLHKPAVITVTPNLVLNIPNTQSRGYGDWIRRDCFRTGKWIDITVRTGTLWGIMIYKSSWRRVYDVNSQENCMWINRLIPGNRVNKTDWLNLSSDCVMRGKTHPGGKTSKKIFIKAVKL